MAQLNAKAQLTRSFMSIVSFVGTAHLALEATFLGGLGGFLTDGEHAQFSTYFPT